jgi:Peptidase family M28/PDZ domain
MFVHPSERAVNIPHDRLLSFIAAVTAFSAAAVCTAVATADDAATQAAIEAVNADELYVHVATLADDSFEGRLVGSRGGHAAGQYIVQQLQKYAVKPAGDGSPDGGDYFQASQRGGRNILALLPGNDSQLSREYIIVGAHYDHVGDGSKGHALGAIGQIYNGADDNASGVAELLEIIEDVTRAHADCRRSILFAFWDGEEMGFLGSQDWTAKPTVPLSAVKLDINLDMVGRLREGRLEVVGTRTGYGMRRLISGAVDDPLWLDYTWELKSNSDHWPFVEHNIPIVMFHTGLHADYHKPTDDADKINREGMREIGRFLIATIVKVADADTLPGYRSAGRDETVGMQQAFEKQQSSSPVINHAVGGPPLRLGLTWRTDDAEPGSVFVTGVMPNSPAALAGLAAGDRIDAINGQPIAGGEAFHRTVSGLLDSGASEFTFETESRGHVRTVTIHWHPTALAAKSST